MKIVCDTALSGKEAINMIFDVKTMNFTRYNYIFMDNNMPGLSGPETTQIIREKMKECDYNVKIIGLTGSALPKEIEILRGSGMDDVLIKPITKQNL